MEKQICDFFFSFVVSGFSSKLTILFYGIFGLACEKEPERWIQFSCLKTLEVDKKHHCNILVFLNAFKWNFKKKKSFFLNKFPSCVLELKEYIKKNKTYDQLLIGAKCKLIPDVLYLIRQDLMLQGNKILLVFGQWEKRYRHFRLFKLLI